MKICFATLIIILSAVLLCGLVMPAEAALADSSPIILLSSKPTDGDILVDVTLLNNQGLSSMLLSLEYDREKLVLKGLEKGDALSSLNIIATNPDDEIGYAVYPFLISWMCDGDEKDYSNGKILTLRFASLGIDTEGKASVTFSYVRDRDVGYYENHTFKTCDLIIDTLHINLNKGEATDIENEITIDDPQPQKDNTTALAVGLSLGGVTVVALAIGLPLLWRKKNLKI